jgi:hypothetical protein
MTVQGFDGWVQVGTAAKEREFDKIQGFGFRV